MSVEMPARVSLPMPPGDPESLVEVVQDVAGAAYWLTVLGDRLAGPAAAARGWLGDDATAATDQIGKVATLTRESANALLEATGRLRAHAECLREARREVNRLRDEQDEDVRAAWRKLAQVPDPQLAVMIGAPAWAGVIDEFEATETARRRRHAVLVEEVEDDAAATAGVLARACGVVGGAGVRGDAGRVVAYLAAELPGWGDLELARRAEAIADEFVGPTTADDMEAAAAGALAYAGSGAFADALLSRLGPENVRLLLSTIGANLLGTASDVARLLAAAFGAAGRDGNGGTAVAAVLSATYLRADERRGDSENVAAGFAAVLAAGRSAPSGGPQTPTVGRWTRQLLLWEHAGGTVAGRSINGWPPDLQDPTAFALTVLAERADSAVSAELLGDARIWETALARTYSDGGAALADVVAQAGREPGLTGARAVRNGLVVIGSGLFAGDPSMWTVDRDVVAAVAPALGAGVAAHPAVAARPLAAAADGDLPDYSRDLLCGLGIVTESRVAAEQMDRALHSWVLAEPPGQGDAWPLAVAVPSAYLAVQEYGQRLPAALDGFEAQQVAETKKWIWDHTVALAVQMVRNPALGIPLGVVEGYAALLLDFDGTWENGPDRGLTFDGDDAAAAVLASLPPDQAAQAVRLAEAARQAFAATVLVVGDPEAPTSPEKNWSAPVVDAAADFAGERVKKMNEVLPTPRMAGPPK